MKSVNQNMSAEDIKMFVIGRNDQGQLALNHTNNVTELTECKSRSFRRVFVGKCQTIFADETYSKLWSSGGNNYGQCAVGHRSHKIFEPTAITYFNEQGIKVKKICTSVSGDATFFITDQGKLYGAGYNQAEQLGVSTERIGVDTPLLIK